MEESVTSEIDMIPSNKPLTVDLDLEEKALLKDCTSRILKHVDRNISQASAAEELSRMLIFRWHLMKNIQ